MGSVVGGAGVRSGRLRRSNWVFSTSACSSCTASNSATRELERVAAKGATLVTCPRGNERTGAGTPPIAEFFESGVRLAVGTDSLASVPDLNVFAELAEMRRLAPAVPARVAARKRHGERRARARVRVRLRHDRSRASAIGSSPSSSTAPCRASKSTSCRASDAVADSAGCSS